MIYFHHVLPIKYVTKQDKVESVQTFMQPRYAIEVTLYSIRSNYAMTELK